MIILERLNEGKIEYKVLGIKKYVDGIYKTIELELNSLAESGWHIVKIN